MTKRTIGFVVLSLGLCACVLADEVNISNPEPTLVNPTPTSEPVDRKHWGISYGLDADRKKLFADRELRQNFDGFVTGSYPPSEIELLDLESSQSSRLTSNYCKRTPFPFTDPNTYSRREPLDQVICENTYSCGFRCLSDVIIAIIPNNQTAAFERLSTGRYIESIQSCSNRRFQERYDLNPDYLRDLRDPGGLWASTDVPYWIGEKLRAGTYTPYCIAATPGFEAEATIFLRRHTEMVLWAFRIGAFAGSPPAHMTISQNQFFRLRGAGVTELREHVVFALEKVTGQKCATNNRMTCSVVASRGRISVSLTTPGTSASGRPGHWEQSEWSVAPLNVEADSFEIEFQLPVTRIKRWPTDGDKPSGDYQTVDYDEKFEDFRASVMSIVADRIGGTYVPSFN